MDHHRYPLTTQARALLRLTEELLERANEGPVEGAPADREERRLSFLRVRPVVEAVAERRVVREPVTSQARIDALFRIARVGQAGFAEAFVAECEAIEAGWAEVMAETEAFMAGLREPARVTCHAEPRRVPCPPPECTALCEDPVVAASIIDAGSTVPDGTDPLLAVLEDAVARMEATAGRDSDTLDFEPEDEPAEYEHAPA